MTKGIPEPIRKEAKAALRAMIALAREWPEDRLDERWVHHRLKPGRYSQGRHRRFGLMSFHHLLFDIGGTVDLEGIGAALESAVPQLRTFVEVDGAVHPISGVELFRNWIFQLVLHRAPSELSYDDADSIVDQADQLLREGRFRYVVRSPLYGLRLPDGVDEVDLLPNVKLRNLSDSEQSEIMSDDRGSPPASVYAEWITCALEISFERELRFHGIEARPEADKFRDEARAVQEIVLAALHVVRSGHCRYRFSEVIALPKVFLHFGGRGAEWQTHGGIGSAIELQRGDDVLLSMYCQQLSKSENRRLLRCARRLTEAEGRHDGTDAFLDCMFALDSILGSPIFKFAINYASLEPADGIARFKKAHAIYDVRNRMAHGSSGEVDAEIAVASNQCLRDVLVRLLADERALVPKIGGKFYELLFHSRP